MKAISLFSGAGGMDLGFHRAGFRTSLACEMNADACATFEANGLGPMRKGSVTDLVREVSRGQADLVFGGPPCQGISVAGKMDPEDPRSSLMSSFFDVVDAVRPAAFVMENVDALMTLEKWRPRLQSIRARASGAGYGIFCTVVDASAFGVPQRRRRFFAVGVANRSDEEVSAEMQAALETLRVPEVPAISVFRRLGPQGTDANPATSRAVITPCRNPVLRRSPYAGMLFNGAGRPIDPARPAPTMTASAGGNKTHIVDEASVFGGGRDFAAAYHAHLLAGGLPGALKVPGTLRRLTVRESAAFQGFPDGFAFRGTTSAVYRQIGNAVPVGLAEAVATALVTTLRNLSAVRPETVLGEAA